MPHTWSHLGDTVSDARYDMYYRGQKIREAYYRGKKIWGEKFVGILLAHLPYKLHYPQLEDSNFLGISVDRLPDKTEYVADEDFDFSGAVIAANYADGSKIDITSECAFIPLNKMPVYNENAGTSHALNEPLDYAGIKILGVWAGGRLDDITADCEFFPEEGTLIDKSTALLGILVARFPDKTTYSAGEPFDYSGTSVVSVYADGHVADITAECEFKPAPVYTTRILVTKLPTGSEGNPYEGVQVVAVYSNGRTADITDECEFERGG